MSFCPLGQTTYSDMELNTIYSGTGGYANAALVVDETTGRISVQSLLAHYNSLLTTGKIPQTPTIQVATSAAAGSTTTSELDLIAYQRNDKVMYENFKSEYCYYEQRYKFALKTFLEKSTSRSGDDNAQAQTYLTVTIKLNRTLNSLVEIMNYIATVRVGKTNEYTQSINTINEQIEQNRIQLQTTYTKLNQDRTGLTVQKEMVEYTQEKNRNVTNQISMWAALNVLAFATIFYVYRST